MVKTFLLSIILLLCCAQNSDCLKTLDDILNENLLKFGVKRHTNNAESNRNKRSEKPGIHFETKQRQEADLPICQNMKGILGKYLLTLKSLFFSVLFSRGRLEELTCI